MTIPIFFYFFIDDLVWNTKCDKWKKVLHQMWQQGQQILEDQIYKNVLIIMHIETKSEHNYMIVD